MTRAAALGGLFAGCSQDLGTRPRVPLSEWTRPIVGGTSDERDPAVVALVSYDMGEYFLDCTGTLIAPKTVLTAAHCIGQYQESVFIGSSLSTLNPSQLIATVRGIAHPRWRDGVESTDVDDIGVFELAKAPALTPIRLYDEPIAAGLSIRHVGFGASVGVQTANDGSGLKREVTTKIRKVQGQIEIGAPGKGHCYGDSGGPGLVVVPGETEERVEGVVSWGPGNCDSESWDTRVDTHLQWIANTISPWDRLPPEGSPPLHSPGPDTSDPRDPLSNGPTNDPKDPMHPSVGTDAAARRPPNRLVDSGDDLDPDADMDGGGCRDISGHPDVVLMLGALALLAARRARR